MEVAIIDWKDSKFVKDDLYEHISAPQWVDFSVTDESVDDESWFCRPDCNHPKTVDDFLKRTPTSKLQRSASVSEILPFGDRNRRDAALKKRGLTQPSVTSKKDLKYDTLVKDDENQNPNLSTPPNHNEKKQVDSFLKKEETPRLKNTLSTRNLFVGRDIMNQITDFCSELKRMAMRANDGENVNENARKSPVVAKKKELKECSGNISGVLEERKPLLEVSKDKCEAMEKKQTRKKPNDKAGNTPISMDLKNIKGKQDAKSHIRTCPPSPQCFSAIPRATKTSTPKPFRSRPSESGLLQELEQSNKEETRNKCTHGGRNISSAAERETRTLDVFWFFKPCTLSN